MRKKYLYVFSISTMLKITNLPVYNNYKANNLQTAPNFGYRLPELPLDDVRDIPELTCGCCGDKMLTKENLNNFLDSFKTKKSFQAPNVMKKLEPYLPRFKGEYKELTQMMELYAVKYPENTFSEIFQKPEVYKLHSTLERLYENQAKVDKMNFFKQITKLSAPLSGKEKLELRETNTRAISILNKGEYKTSVREALVKNEYKQFAQICTNKEVLEKIMEEVENFPYETHAADSIILNCSIANKPDKALLSQIVQNLEATFDHIELASEGGTYAQSNGVTICGYCNKERNSLPYPKFLIVHPELVENIQKQFKKILTFITKGKLLHYDDYPEGVKKKLLEYADEKINLKIDDYLKFKEQAALQKLEMSKALFEEKTEKHKIAHARYEETERKLEEALAMVRRLKKEKAECSESLQKAWNEKVDTEYKMNRSSAIVKKTQQAIEEDRAVDEKLKKK